MANLFDFHLFPEPVEHTAVLLTGVKCVRGGAAACSLPPPLWSGERLLRELQPGSRGSTSRPVPRPAPSGGGELGGEVLQVGFATQIMPAWLCLAALC